MTGKFKDKFLISGSLAGDEQAFAQLYDKYVEQIYKFIIFRVSRKEEAQDLTSEAFLKVWQYISRADNEIDDFKSLLYKIARNLTIDYYRQKGREVLALETEQWEKIVDQSITISEKMLVKDDLRLISEALNNLPNDQRDLIIMRYLDDLSVFEIARVLDKKAGAVRVALHRALKKLKKVISNQ